MTDNESQKQLGFDLRDRIAAVLRESSFPVSVDTYLGLAVADVLIRELGLQMHLAKRIINGKPDQWVRRHVTDWEIVDE